jgi:hypothetical protein
MFFRTYGPITFLITSVVLVLEQLSSLATFESGKQWGKNLLPCSTYRNGKLCSAKWTQIFNCASLTNRSNLFFSSDTNKHFSIERVPFTLLTIFLCKLVDSCRVKCFLPPSNILWQYGLLFFPPPSWIPGSRPHGSSLLELPMLFTVTLIICGCCWSYLFFYIWVWEWFWVRRLRCWGSWGRGLERTSY